MNKIEHISSENKSSMTKLSARLYEGQVPSTEDFHKLNMFERRAKFAKFGSVALMFWYGVDLITDLYIGGDIFGPLAAISFMFYLVNKNKSHSIAQLPFRYNDEFLYVVKSNTVHKIAWENIKPCPFKMADLTIDVPLELYEEHPKLGKSFKIPLYDMDLRVTMDDTRKVIELTKKGSQETPQNMPGYKNGLKKLRDSDFSTFSNFTP